MAADILYYCSTLTHRLLMRVLGYFEEQLAVLEDRNMSASETSRWFNQTLDNVRLRHRKLLRFGRYVSLPPGLSPRTRELTE
jgi:mitogen-activated protein kinase kinase kinase